MAPNLRSWGVRIARAQDQAPPSIDLERQRRRFVSLAKPEQTVSGDSAKRQKVHVVALAAAAFGAVAALSVLAVLRFWTARPLTFQVGDAHGKEGEWIAASSARELPIAFSDGSALVLAHEARARVADVSRDGAKIFVERGGVDVAIMHRDHSRWEVDAGPFKVYVVGTRFDVSWDPVGERFELALRNGRVRVEGPTISSTRTGSAGERLEIALGTPGRGPASPAASASSRAVSVSAPPAPSCEVMTLARTSASDLIAMADIARYSARPKQAVEALLHLRTTLPTDPGARRAAFLLGRIYFDQLRSYAEAARWFSTYLTESPNDSFVQEAAGRLIESEERSGAPVRARQAASAYLERYPEGPHATLARRVLLLQLPAGTGSPEL